MADSVAQELEVLELRDGEAVAVEEMAEHQLAAGLAAHAVLEAQETPVEADNHGGEEFAYLPLEVQEFVNRHTASGVLDRDEFVSLILLYWWDMNGSSFMAELVTIFIKHMDAWFLKAAAWAQQLPNMQEIAGHPNRVAAMRVYDEFLVRLAAYTTVCMMGAQRLKDALWEFRARKHAYDRQGCQTALPVAELAYAEFKGVLHEFVEIEHLAQVRTSLVPIARSLSAAPLSSKLLYPANIFRAVNSRELYATAFDRTTGEED